MADLLPIAFPVPGESAIASYDFTDISEGVGYIKYYAYLDMDLNGRLTTSSSIGSHKAFTMKATDPILSKNFETIFNVPKNFKGNVICNIPVAGAAGNNRARTAAITIYHVDLNGTAASLGTDAGTDTANGAAATLSENEIITIVIPIALKHFKKGETLRINVVITGADGDEYVGHDPYNRLGTSPLTTSQMAFFMPAILDL